MGRLDEGADLVAADGFLLQQGGSQPVEGFPVAGEQVAGLSLRLGRDGGGESGRGRGDLIEVGIWSLTRGAPTPT